MFRMLLVPLDGSPFGEQALPLAASIARRASAGLELAHVHVPFHFYGAPSAVAPELDEEARKPKRAYLDQIVNTLKADGIVNATSSLLVGEAANALYDHALAKGVDLVVMTTHGRGPLTRFWLGSVASDLTHRLPMPVLLVRPQEPGSDGPKKPVFRHILVALDGSKLAEQVLEPAASMAAVMGAHITLVQVLTPLEQLVEEPPGPALGGLNYTLRVRLQKLHEEKQKETQAYLEKLAQGIHPRPLQVQVRVIDSDNTASALLEHANRHGVDLIAVSTRGRGGLARFLLGSVADKVVRGATVPVLVLCPHAK